MSDFSEYLLISDDRRSAEVYRVYVEGTEKYRVRYYQYNCKSLDSDYENHTYIFEESNPVGFLEMSRDEARERWKKHCGAGYSVIKDAIWSRVSADQLTELKVIIPRKKAKARKRVDMTTRRRYNVDIALSE